MKKLLLSLFAIMAFFACTDSGSDDVGGGNSNNDQNKAPEIALDASEVNFKTEGGSTAVTFTSSDAWTAETINNRADGWCSVSPTSGSAGNAKITITATANDTTDDRTATVVIKSGTTKKTISVSQKQKDALTVTSSKLEVSADGGEIEIEVKANIDFSVEIEESAKSWVTHRSTRAMKTSTLIMEIDENDDTEKRKANITIKSGTLTETVTIYQDGFTPSIVLTQNEYTIPSAGETIAVEIKSNVDVTIEIPNDVDWISENTTRATSTNTYYFDIAPNEEYDVRKAEIKVINKENNLSEPISINQSQKDAIVIANDSYEVKGIGGDIEIEVGHNVEFDVTIDGEWITQQQTRALETTKLTFIVAENTTDKAREGSIIFTSKDGAISQKIFVTQSAPVYEIIYTSSNGKIVTPNETDVFGANIISNIYENGKGIITFDRRVTKIGNRAFKDCSRLTSITIPDGVTSIGQSVFYGCSSLKMVNIPNSVTSIGNSAFFECYSLTSVTISKSVTSIENYTFEGCSSLISITIPDGVTSIGSRAFKDCSRLTSITIPDGVTSIDNWAFSECRSLTSVTIPDSVTSLGESAFCWCDGLTSVTIGNSVTSIGLGTFFDCYSLTGVITIPDSVTSLGENAFYGCNSLTSVTIGNSVTSIGKSAFSGCSSLANIAIGNSVTSIGSQAFRDCNNLTSITIPDNVTSIGEGAFYNCSSLMSFYGKYASNDNHCLIIDGVLNSFTPAAKLTTYTIPDNVTSIGGWAFSYSKSLTSITIPDSVTSIGDWAFYHCESLTSITIPKNVSSIRDYTFSSCKSLTSITIPESITSIGAQAFSQCQGLTNVTIPRGVTSIGDWAFSGCKKLISVYCKPTTPPILKNTDVFSSITSCRKIYVPAASVDDYKNAAVWTNYADEIFADPTEN